MPISDPAPSGPPPSIPVIHVGVSSAKPTAAAPPAAPEAKAEPKAEPKVEPKAAPAADGKATPPAAAAPDGKTPPAAPAKPDPAAGGLAELARKENAFRNEKKKHDDEVKAFATERQQRAEKEARWKEDPLQLLEDHGHTIDAVIEFAAAGGSTSTEGKLRALERKIENDKKKAEEERKKQEEDAAAEQRRQAAIAAHQQVKTRVDELLKDEKFELCAIQARRGKNIAGAIAQMIRTAWSGVPEIDEHGNATGNMVGGGKDLSVDEALAELEVALDTDAIELASSKKLKAKLGQVSTDGKKQDEQDQQSTRQNDSDPPAPARRSITIKNQQQAVAPIRTKARVEGRLSSQEVSAKVAANIAAMLQKK